MHRLAWVALALTLCAGGLRAQATTVEPAAIPLWAGRAPGAVGDSAVDRPTITPYLAPAGTGSGTAVVIFPGGGYAHLAVEKEGTRVAKWLNGLGVSGFVVQYRLGPRYHDPAMLEDAQRAVRMVRARAAEWHVDTARVGVLGSSAGGHLAATAATHYDAGRAASADPIERMSSRPSFEVLLYPVITMDARFAHMGSRRVLLGDSPDSAAVKRMSDEQQVTPETPPAFIVATSDDATVPVENSVAYYRALRAAGVPAELHLFETGKHGFGLAETDPVLSIWPRLCEAWLRHRGLLAAAH